MSSSIRRGSWEEDDSSSDDEDLQQLPVPGPSKFEGPRIITAKNKPPSKPKPGPGDSKISNLIRQVARCESYPSLVEAVDGVVEKLMQLENRKYLHRAFHFIAASLAEVFRPLSSGIDWASKGVEKLAYLLSKMHFAITQVSGTRQVEEGTRSVDNVPLWLIDVVQNRASTHKSSGRPRELNIVHDTFIKFLDLMREGDLYRITTHLLDRMENVACATTFKYMSTLFAHTLKVGNNWQDPRFADFVDLVIGWMIDEDGRIEDSQYWEDFLLLLRPHFIQDSQFSKTLINQICEDAEAEAVLEKLYSDTAPKVVKRIMFLIKAYSAMLKLGCVEDKPFVNELSERVLSICVLVLNNVVLDLGDPQDDLMLIFSLANQVISQTHGLDGQFTRTFIKTEIESLRHSREWEGWPYSVFSSVLQGLCCWTEAAVSATMLIEDTHDLVDKLLSFLDEISDSKEKILLIHALLRTRNVQLLQKVYCWHLSKLQDRDKDNVPFVLSGLSDIAGNKSGSILSLYALQPSLVDVLIDLSTKEERDGDRRQAILDLLKTHCTHYSHWVSSLTTHSIMDHESPGARFLPSILSFWTSQLYSTSEFSKVSDKLWFIHWAIDFLLASSDYAPTLYDACPQFFEALITFISIANGKHHDVIWKEEKPKITQDVVAIPAVPVLDAMSSIVSQCLAISPTSEDHPQPHPLLLAAPKKNGNASKIFVSKKGEWPYLKELQEILEIFTKKDSKYSEVGGLRSFLDTFVNSHIFNDTPENGDRIPMEVVPLLISVIQHSPILTLSTRPSPWWVWPEQESIPIWTIKVQEFPTTQKDYKRYLNETEFGAVLYKILFVNGDDDVVDNDGDAESEDDFDPERLKPLMPDEPPLSGRRTSETYDLNSPPSDYEIRAAVDMILRQKLRSPVGGPSELFNQLHNSIKVGVSKGVGVPKWKLDFLFLLEQGITLWIGGSHILPVPLSEPIRLFYQTNKTPCTEWLKRIRGDVVDAGVMSNEYYHAYYHASLGDDPSALELSGFLVQDEPSVISSKAAQLYLQGDFEGALRLLGEESDGCDPLGDMVDTRAAHILALEPAEKLSPETYGPLDFLHIQRGPRPSILDTQISFLLQEGGGAEERLSSKVELNLLPLEEERDFWTLLQVCDILRALPSLPLPQKRSLWLKLGAQMVSLGNINWTEKFLKNYINFDKLRELSDDFMTPGNDAQLDVLLLTGKLLLASPDDAAGGGAFLYNKLIQRNFFNLDDIELDKSSERVALILSMAKEFQKAPATLRTIVEDIGWFDEAIAIDGDIATLAKTQPDTTAFAILLEKGLEYCESSGDLWLQVGDAYYSYQKFDQKAWELRAFQAYCNYLRFSTPSASPSSLVMAISRVIAYIKACDGHTPWACNPEDIFTSKLWLEFLPEIGQTAELRPLILARFGARSALFLWPHDSSPSPESMSVSVLARKTLLDPSPFALIDMSDDPYNHSTYIPYHCPSCPEAINESRSMIHHWSKGALGVPLEVHTLGKELLRLGTSSEDIWASSLQRILNDWHRRFSSLKKDMVRDPEPGKVVAYIQPVLFFLKELWAYTLKTSQSPAQLAFIVKNSSALGDILRELETATSMDAALATFEKLLFHAETFEQAFTYKTSLQELSPKLGKIKDWGSGLTVLGIPEGVTISGIHSVVHSLHTKTRPKKIRLIGSNGRPYDFLVKGNENLRVDAGMMQLFSIAKYIINQPIQHFCITPLGNRGGLIQMVEGATAVFQLYKKYLMKTSTQGMRTSDIFWRKMADHGVAQGDKDRAALDVQILRQVFQSLKEESPSDLISREFLFAANDVRSWFKAVKGFTRDSGIAAGIGYLLGIGDRHLDNILVDYASGKLVHVDFSLVFNKGEKLKVPECVPFRLTQNFAKALQSPGPEGPFAHYLEQVFKAFQSNSELLKALTRNIAMACHFEEDFVINPHPLRAVELSSALAILKFRLKKLKPMLLNQKVQVMLHCTNPTSLEKNVDRYRRILANIDPQILYIAKEVSLDSRFGPFKALVDEKYLPEVSHYFFHCQYMDVLEMAQKFELAELTLEELDHTLHTCLEASPTDLAEVQPCLELISKPSVDLVVSKVIGKLDSLQTRLYLINEAQNESNLCRMFEGWTPWI